MRIELEDILDEDVPAIEAEHLGESLIRFRLGRPRPPSPYHRFLIEKREDLSALLPEAPNRASVEHNLEQIRAQLGAAFASQRDHTLLRRAGVDTTDDFLRLNLEHFCRPHWLYTNAQALVSLVERSPEAFEAIAHASLQEYFRFGSPYGPWPLLEAGRGARFASRLAVETWIGQRLLQIAVQPLTVARGGERRVVFLQAAGARSTAGGRVRTFLIHHRSGVRRERQGAEEETYALLNRLELDGFRARACATCAHFGFSGMSRDMSGGGKGYCGLRERDSEASLPRQALVSVFDSCEHHLLVGGAEGRGAYRSPTRPRASVAPPPEEAHPVEPIPPSGRPLPSARDVARMMVDNLRENRKDPDFMRRKAIEIDRVAAEIIAERGLWSDVPREPLGAASGRPPLVARRPLARGRHADLFLADRAGQSIVIKLARAPAASPEPPEPLIEYEARFTTGLMIYGDPDRDEMIRCEAEALTALAPATPAAIESGVRPSDGRAYVLREYVEGETWRAILDRGGEVGPEPLRKLVEMLAKIEESTDLGFHGDLKPDNVIATPGGELVLIDPTSAFLRRTENGPLERALLTGEYNPRLEPSDHAALALTIIEMLTGEQLVAAAAGREAARPIGPRLAASLRFAAATGSDSFARRLPAIRLPGELSPRLAGAAEALLLRALGLSCQAGVLEVGEPLGRIRELEAVLGAL